jgi:Arc/MetJ family transcription regulator
MHKTTIAIDEKLLKAASKAIGAKTKKDAIEAGLHSLVRASNREALRKELGAYDISLTLRELEESRYARPFAPTNWHYKLVRHPKGEYE